jgi:hypothetical protein
MGQHLPDRLFWAREEADATGEASDAVPAIDVRGSH